MMVRLVAGFAANICWDLYWHSGVKQSSSQLAVCVLGGIRWLQGPTSTTAGRMLPRGRPVLVRSLTLQGVNLVQD